MLLCLYGLVASLFNRNAKIFIRALILLIITAGVYSFMMYKAIAFVDDGTYYSVNNWAENLVIIAVIIEGTGIVLWFYTIYNTLKK